MTQKPLVLKELICVFAFRESRKSLASRVLGYTERRCQKWPGWNNIFSTLPLTLCFFNYCFTFGDLFNSTIETLQALSRRKPCHWNGHRKDAGVGARVSLCAHAVLLFFMPGGRRFNCVRVGGDLKSVINRSLSRRGCTAAGATDSCASPWVRRDGLRSQDWWALWSLGDRCLAVHI